MLILHPLTRLCSRYCILFFFFCTFLRICTVMHIICRPTKTHTCIGDVFERNQPHQLSSSICPNLSFTTPNVDGSLHRSGERLDIYHLDIPLEVEPSRKRAASIMPPEDSIRSSRVVSWIVLSGMIAIL